MAGGPPAWAGARLLVLGNSAVRGGRRSGHLPVAGGRGPPVGGRSPVVHKQLAHTAEHLVGEPGIHGQVTERVAGNLGDCGIVAGRVVNSEPNSGFLLMNGAAPLVGADRGGPEFSS